MAKDMFEDSKGIIKAVNQRKDNTIANRKRKKMVDKTLNRKLKIEQYKPRKGKQSLLH